MRLFVALGVAEPVRREIAAVTAPARERFDGLNWTAPASWHVTLAFLGEVDDERAGTAAEALADGVGRTGVGPIHLRLDEPGHFGQRVAWLGIRDQPRGAVAALGADVQAAMAEAEMPVDRREVRAHLTLARARGRRGRLPGGLLDAVDGITGEWSVGEVGLYRSHLGRPVRYERIAAAPL